MKRAFNLVANISSILLMGILLIGCLALFELGFEEYPMGIVVGIMIFSIGTIIISA